MLQAEQSHGSDTTDHPITRETARWLALWMAFDDVIRVADLKSRAARMLRLRREARVGEHDVLKVYDHFKPGVPEIAGLLPPAWAAKALAWDRRRIAAGRAPWALPLKVATHTFSGWLILRALASLRWARPWGSRYLQEQSQMQAWIDRKSTRLNSSH